MINLVASEERESMRDGDIRAMVEKLYWKKGATDFSTGSKTLTLQQFENRYMQDFYESGLKYKDKNISRIFQNDLYLNIFWPLAHLKSAGAYLIKDPDILKATGGTNWQKYLPPKFQKRMFFPELWTAEEIRDWGSAVFTRR
jgi:tryptophan 2,3-dioxygenase